jgi:rare lipoprotein A
MNRLYRIARLLPFIAIALSPLWLAGCASDSGPKTIAPKKATSRPYVIKGQTYHPQEHYEYDDEGTASYYGIRDGFHGKKTATGEVYDAHGITAAHKTLPLPTIVRVTNLENGRSLTVKVNDRGPFPKGRVIDVSEKCAKLLGFYGKGTARVRVQSLVEETLALQKNPHGHEPIMVASDGTQMKVDKSTPPPLASKTKGNVMLASAKQGAGQQAPMPQHRPGWIAVNDLIKPQQQAKGSVYAQAAPRLNENPTTPLAASVTPGSYFIRAGTFSRLQNAEKLSQKLKSLTNALPVRLNTVSVNKTPMFTVRIGPLKNTEEAEKLIQKMAKAGHYDAQIISE